MSTPALVNAILARGYGGSDAAVVPGQHEVGSLPRGAAPAGVDDVIRLVLSRMTDTESTDTLADWVFLVGGPGNGKSFQLAQLLSSLQDAGLDVSLAETGKAARKYPPVVGKARRLHVVNDATIRPPADARIPVAHLALDLAEAMADRGACLVVNVNRGVLIEELSVCSTQNCPEPIFRSIKWLVTGEADGVLLHTHVSGDGFYRAADLHTDDQAVIRLHLVSLDALSLLESVPDESGASVVGLGTASARCADYRVMTLGSEQRCHTPIGQMLAGLSEQLFTSSECHECGAASLCPFRANLQVLRQSSGQGLLSLMRAAEILSGRLLTYRDAWAILRIGAIGPTVWESSECPCDWVRERYSRSQHARDRAKALSELVLLRTHNSVFRRELPSPRFLKAQSWRLSEVTLPPAVLGLSIVDPARDVSPDWAAAVSDAMEAISHNESPLEYLARHSSHISGAITDLDRQFEQEFLTIIAEDGLKEKERRDHLRWLGTSYYRLFALAVVRPGQAEIVREWVDLRSAVAARQKHMANSRLHWGLQQLLLPCFGGGGYEQACFLPMFSPRVEPIRSPQEEPSLCVSIPVRGMDAIQLTYELRGDSLWVALDAGSDGSRETKRLARLPLDYFTCRESLVCVNGHGFTDAAATSIPRVERLRASLSKEDGDTIPLAIVSNEVLAIRPLH